MRKDRLAGAVLPCACAALITLSGCATAGATLGSGVGDRLLDDPPYYAGKVPLPLGRVAHLPVTFQRGDSQSSGLDGYGDRYGPLATLLQEMNDYVDSRRFSRPLSLAEPIRGTGPDVRFGCEEDLPGECVREGGDPSARGAPWMLLAVGRPSASWTRSVERTMAAAGASRVLVLTLEVGQYWPDQKNWRGSKEVRLGTGYAVPVPWLTALDRPVQVLQLTGALVDPSGRVHRIGAEGLLARRTSLLLDALGVQETLTVEDVERLRSARRDDLPGRPLVWQAGLQNLLAELTADAADRFYE